MRSVVVFEDLTRKPRRYEFSLHVSESPRQLEELVSLLRGSASEAAHRMAETIQSACEGLEERRRERVAVVREGLEFRG
ncbi:MAG: hypothetical protein IT371_14330 [Deltaproteobacteria bacterium]|nr:hypothetical protein [Deltaproteobacteria bacterium]